MAEGKSGEIEPVYLTLGDVLELHALIIGATPAEASTINPEPTADRLMDYGAELLRVGGAGLPFG